MSRTCSPACRRPGPGLDRQQLERALGQVEREIELDAGAIAKSGPLDSLLAALTAREEKRSDLRRELDSQRAEPRLDPRRVEKMLRETLEHGRAVLLQRHVARTRQWLRPLLGGTRVLFTPRQSRRGRFYELTARRRSPP